MAVFDYRGVNASGKEVTGQVDAENVSFARQKLKTQGIYVSALSERQIAQSVEKADYSPRRWFERVTREDITVMTRQLATLVAANIPLVDALTALGAQVEKDSLKAVVSQVKQQVNEGSSLAKALEKFPRYFSELFVNMVAAGEASGALDLVLLRVAEFMEYQDETQKKVFSALTYPLVVMGISILGLIAVFVFVIPTIRSVFEQLGAELPLPTRILIGTSEIILNYWYLILIAIAVTIWAVRRRYSTPEGRRTWDKMTLRSPIFGSIVRLLNVSRFAKTLSILLSSGIPLLSALTVVKNVMTNRILREAVAFTEKELTDGKGFSGPLERSGEFPPLLTHMVAIGEKTGELELMLTKASEHFASQVTYRVERLTAMLTPALILILFLFVFGIVLSVLLPFFELQNAI